MNICYHFDHLRTKTKCELGQGRTAPRDCRSCSAYDPDPNFKHRTEEADRIRDDAWAGLVMRAERAGI